MYLFLGKKQETDDGQPVVGAFRPQDLALLLLQRRHATDRLAPAAQLRHHPAGQITGKEMHEEKKFCFFFVFLRFPIQPGFTTHKTVGSDYALVYIPFFFFFVILRILPVRLNTVYFCTVHIFVCEAPSGACQYRVRWRKNLFPNMEQSQIFKKK